LAHQGSNLGPDD